MRIALVEARTPELVGRLTQLWRGSVEATHEFLTPADIDRIATYVPGAIGEVAALALATDAKGNPLGFAGVQDGSLEMLFVDAAHLRQGVGGALLRFAAEELSATSLEVNAQNPNARRFYERCGWHVSGYRETDDFGEPYPLLRMECAPFGATELAEAKRQIDSTLHKLEETLKTLRAKENVQRLKSQITLATRRIEAFAIANTLIERELDQAKRNS